MNCRFKVYLVFLCSLMTPGIPLNSMAATPPSSPTGLRIIESKPAPVPITPPGNDGLLSRMTPGNYNVPSGWTILRTQDFEKGSIAWDEWLGGMTSVSKVLAHTGNYAIRAYFSYDAATCSWGINGTAPTGPYTELYISFYEYTESQARFHTEYIWGSNTKGEAPNPYYRVNFNYFNAKGWNGTDAPYVIQGEGSSAYRDAFAWYGPTKTIPTGRWVQREVWHRPNTPGNNDGFVRFYENGVLVQSAENANTNGSADFRAGTWIQVGGLYTAHVWRIGDPYTGTCSSSPGEGSGYDRVMDFDNCPCPNQCPPDGKIPKFFRYIDDIIIMKR